MIIGVVYSLNDPAGAGIAEKLASLRRLELGGKHRVWLDKNVFIQGFPESVLEFEFLHERAPADAYLVLSKHRSESGKPCFTVHHTGNPLDSAELGGKPRELSWSFPRLAGLLLRKVFEETKKEGVENVDVCYEVTHHGPTSVPKPLVFLEIGSTEVEWRNEVYQTIIARSVDRVLPLILEGEGMGVPRAVGFGGGHYPRKFTSLTIEGEAFFGHMLAKYVLRGGVTRDVIIEAIEKNYEGVTKAFIERKSARKELRDEIKKLCEERGLDVEVI